MSDIYREFELTIWEESLNFGIVEGNSLTTAHTLQKPNNEQNKRKGEMRYESHRRKGLSDRHYPCYRF